MFAGGERQARYNVKTSYTKKKKKKEKKIGFAITQEWGPPLNFCKLEISQEASEAYFQS